MSMQAQVCQGVQVSSSHSREKTRLFIQEPKPPEFLQLTYLWSFISAPPSHAPWSEPVPGGKYVLGGIQGAGFAFTMNPVPWKAFLSLLVAMIKV